MIRRFAIAALVSTMFLVGCDSGNSSTGTTPTTDGTLSGSYKSAEAIQGLYQTFTFGPGNRLTYLRGAQCVDEMDTGTAQLQTIGGTLALSMSFTSGAGADLNYQGTSVCAPIVHYAPADITIIGGPYPFRWVVAGT